MLSRLYKIFVAFLVSLFSSESKANSIPELNKDAMDLKNSIVDKYKKNPTKNIDNIITYYDDKHNLEDIVNLSEELKLTDSNWMNFTNWADWDNWDTWNNWNTWDTWFNWDTWDTWNNWDTWNTWYNWINYNDSNINDSDINEKSNGSDDSDDLNQDVSK